MLERSAIAACSVGRKMLTSPPDGFSVPTNPTMISGTKRVTVANPSPVRPISAHDQSNSERLPSRASRNPANNVSAADPSRVAVTTMPICSPLKPRWVRYRASSTLANPSANARMARATMSGRVGAAGTAALYERLRLVDRSNRYSQAGTTRTRSSIPSTTSRDVGVPRGTPRSSTLDIESRYRMPIPRGDPMVVSVRYIVDDVDAAVAFYTKHFGFTPQMQAGPAFADVIR